MKISQSPDRNTFQKEMYVKRCEEKNEEVSQAYLEMYDSFKDQHDHKFDDPESRIDNLEYDLLTTDWILEKVRNNETYAQNLYAAMCNTDFVKNDVWPILTEKKWHCSWRYAGGIIADMRQEGDYIDWYCSGIRGNPISGDEDTPIDKALEEKLSKYVGEGCVTDEIREDLLKLGWIVIDEENDT
jgi:hypothetical protein